MIRAFAITLFACLIQLQNAQLGRTIDCIDNTATREWFCVVIGDDVVTTSELEIAQQLMGMPEYESQAIFKMTGETPGKMTDLPQNWNGGGMFSWGDGATADMQRLCRLACPLPTPPPTSPPPPPTEPPIKCNLFYDVMLTPNRPWAPVEKKGNGGRGITKDVQAKGPEAMARFCTDNCFTLEKCKFVALRCFYMSQRNRGFGSYVAPTTYWRTEKLDYCECYFREEIGKGPKMVFDRSWYYCPRN